MKFMPRDGYSDTSDSKCFVYFPTQFSQHIKNFSEILFPEINRLLVEY